MRKIYKSLKARENTWFPRLAANSLSRYCREVKTVNTNAETLSAKLSTGTTFVLYHSGLPK